MKGKLHLYLGPMKSGKTLNLIHEIDSARRKKLRFLALQPAQNTRQEDQGKVISRMSDGNGGEQLIYRPARKVSSFQEVDEEVMNGIDVVLIDEIWMIGQSSQRAKAQKHALIEAQLIYAWLEKGVTIHATSLNRLANTNVPPLLIAIDPFNPQRHLFTADCDLPGCRKRATYTAILAGDGSRVPLRDLPDYVPQESLDESKAQRHYHPYCQEHFFADIDVSDLMSINS